MLVKDVPILKMLYNRRIVALTAIRNAKTLATRHLWEHRKECYQQAINYIKMAEGLEDAKEEATMDFSNEVYHVEAGN